MNIRKTKNKIPLTNKTPKHFGSMAIREGIHFINLPEDPVMASNRVRITRAFKAVFLEITSDQTVSPQNLQYLCSPCHLWSSKKPYFENIKKSPGFCHRNARCQRPKISLKSLMWMQPIMELEFDREQNHKERLAFIRRYSKWMKSVPNEVRGRQQASLINSYLNRSKNFQPGRKEYLLTKNRSKAVTIRMSNHN